MATNPIAIFPSLTRAPGMDSSEQVEDDTIRDQMESGYVASRPRFTRARRTWNVNTRHLVAEDVRALRTFRDTTVLRGALPFYYPNLLANSSFELPSTLGSTELVKSWSATTSNKGVLQIGTAGYRGSYSNQVGAGTSGNVAVSVSASGAATAVLQCNREFTCNAGDTVTVAMLSTTTQSAGSLVTATASITVQYPDGTNSTVTAGLLISAAGWALSNAQLVLPAPASAETNMPGTAVLSISFSSASEPTGQTGSTVILIDNVGAAITALSLDAIQMAGSAPIPALVRFASGGLPQFSDLGWIGGQKRYGATFKIEEM